MTVTELLDVLVGVHGALTEAEVGHALVGGLAVGARTQPRTTKDVDLAVAVSDDAEAERLVGRLRTAGYEVSAIVEQDEVGRLATARLFDEAGVLVDLLFASSGIEPEVVARAERVAILPSRVVPVARPEELLAMKILSMAPRREHDARDARWLVEYNPDLDLDLVRSYLDLIVERGFSRGQDLHGKLDGVLALAIRA